MENDNQNLNVEETVKPVEEIKQVTEGSAEEVFIPIEKVFYDSKTEYIKRMILCGIYAIFFTICLYQNGRGITYPMFAIATIVVYVMFLKAVKEKIKAFSYVLMGFITLLSINVCTTMSTPLIVFDKLFIFALFFIMFLYNLYDDKTWDATRYFLACCAIVTTAIAYVLDPILDAVHLPKEKEEDGKEKKKNYTFLYVLLGLAISVPLLCVVLPLLLSSDIVFSNTMGKIFDFEWNADVFKCVLLAVFIFFVGYALLKRLYARSEWMENPVSDKRKGNPVVSITISSVLLVFYGLYSGIQIVYLFMGYGTLPDGYTYADYAHEGFFQLVFVCIINLILVLLCRKFSRDNKVLKIMLTLICACTYIMIFSSAYRMILYISVYGLTFLRVYVLWALTVIMLAMTGTVILIYMEKMPFVKYSMVVLAATWIIFGYSHPDVIIAEYNINMGTGQIYVMEDLSDDAIPVVLKYQDSIYEKPLLQSYLINFEKECRGYDISGYGDIRKFNFAEYKAYKAIIHGMHYIP